ncbi:Transcriptional regulator [gamma proteobacterium HdN1]|nr:Transcriptional regulator [gamma proteobacterium HdN1]
MPRKPRQTRSRATYEAIVEAGFRCVAEHGVANTTTRAIADQAGVGVGSLYEYFKDKDAIFAAMNERIIHDVVVLIQRVGPLALELDIESAISHFFDAFNRFLLADNERYLKVAREVLSVDTRDSVEPISKALQDMVVQYLLKHRPLLNSQEDIPALAYIIINSSIFVMLRLLSTSNPPITYEQLKNGMARLVSVYAKASHLYPIPPPP